MEIAGSLELRRLGQPRWWWHTVAGVLAIVLGAILLFGNPVRGILALLWVVGVLAIASRVALIIAAVIARREVTALYREIGEGTPDPPRDDDVRPGRRGADRPRRMAAGWR